jgi:polyphosphate kinase
MNMKNEFIALIQREIAHSEEGRSARIIAKCNSLEDREIIEALYEASRKGVHIDLIVRGFCSLDAGVPGLSEHIRVMSVIGRFLEHSRLFYFQNGAEKTIDGDFFIGSADWMYRNLHGRIETAVPILDRKLKRRCWEILNTTLSDQRQAWDMEPGGTYVQRAGDGEIGSQERLMQLTSLRADFNQAAED